MRCGMGRIPGMLNHVLAAGRRHTVGLREDGTVVAAGNNAYGQCNVDEWRDIVAIAAGCAHTVALRADGTVVAAGSNEYGQCDVSGWSGIRLPAGRE
ncbi:hypothetical protein Theco_1961 [Thermobacillus composti KWC4]|uniref:Regulator of chromosome condensation (RCC1) repeat protein n=1 Tax=Thermobacillus composti (strain DSM 18247 / JCM 13945 / KWC4) TaxID=717605 RepID=L0ECT0_THECK|nr:hypothetical protein Theco_1961 [Thermobacillus composti KWC4]